MEDEVDTTDGGRNPSSLMTSGLPITGFLKIVGDGDGGQISSVTAASTDGVPLLSSWTRARTAERSLTADGSGLGVRSVVAREIWESGRALNCLEEGVNIEVAMDAEDLERRKGEIGTLPVPPTPRTGLISLARAEEEATWRSLNLPVKLPVVVSRLALVKIGLRFAFEAVGLGTLTVARV